jgi:hypothetical protein
MTKALADVEASDFAQHVGDTFSFELNGVAVFEGKLSSCVENPRGTMKGAKRTAFSITFDRDAAGAPDAGGSLVVVHPTLGRLGPVYVERIHPAELGWSTAVFQIVFN